MKVKELEVDFFTHNSIVYNISFQENVNIGFKNVIGYCGEIHVHYNQYNVVRITIIVSHKSKIYEPDFIESLIIELDYKLSSVFGILDKGDSIETNLVVFYNQLKVIYGPFLFKQNDIRAAADFIKKELKKKLKEL